MRTYVLLSALALAGCASPEAAFPRLVDMKKPPEPSSTSIQRQGLYAEIARAGEVTRAAGKMVRDGEISAARLPR
ncbi:MAG: hypothetical protein QM698_02430 [Micropepsaceae bacterium]